MAIEQFFDAAFDLVDVYQSTHYASSFSTIAVSEAK